MDGRVTFEEILAVRLPALLRQATVLAGDPYLAEDVVQEVVVKAQPGGRVSAASTYPSRICDE